ncbi:siderophore-iron reductase, Fe-S cluster protein, partial [Pseudomonas syringae pv. tagetis]
SLSPRALLDVEVCELVLETLRPVIGSPTQATTASLLANRFSPLSTGACPSPLPLSDNGFIPPLHNSVIEYPPDDRHWTSSKP